MGKEYYEKICFKYGVACLLAILPMLIELELYEECHSINEVLVAIGIDTTVSHEKIEKHIDWWIDAIVKITKTDGNISRNNLPIYCMEVMGEISANLYDKINGN